MPQQDRMTIEAWSDVVCPWCAIGKVHLERALARFAHRDQVDVVWRSHELNPGAPRVTESEYPALLAQRYSTSPGGGRAMADRISYAAELAGLVLRLDLVRPVNSFDAHRVVHLARSQGRESAVLARLQTAYLTEGALLSDPPTLVRLAEEAGLPPGLAGPVLDSDAFAEAVRAEEEDGLRRGVEAVPTFIVDDVSVIPGAQSVDSLLASLDRAWSRGGRPD